MTAIGDIQNRSYSLSAVAFAMAILVLTLAASCGKNAPGGHADSERYYKMDSVLKKVSSSDTLAALAQQYHNEGDAQAEMLALKYEGKKLRDQSNFNEAIKIHTRGLELATNLSDTIEMINALNNLGTDYRRLGELGKASEYHYSALRLSDNYSDNNSDEAIKCDVVSLNGIGNIEITLQNYDEADSVFRRALEGERRLGSATGQAINLANLGAIMHALGQADLAWSYYRKSMQFNKEAGNDVGIGLCHLHFGELFEDERNFAHAQVEYKKAYDLMQQTGDSWHWLEACVALARVNLNMNDNKAAMAYALKADSMATAIDSKEHEQQVLNIRHALAERNGDYKLALDYFKRSRVIHDSLVYLGSELQNQRLDYERARSSGELDVLNKDIAREKRMRNMLIGFMILSILLAGAIIGVLYYAVKAHSRSQRMLSQVEETRSLFFTNVVHLLRTPLTAIMGATDDIINDTSNHTPAQRQNAEILERQGNNLLLLVDRILEVGSVRSAINSLEWRRGDAVGFLRMVIESYRDDCQEKHIELNYAPRENSVDIDTVPQYLSSIVGSLISNAIAYSNEFSKITITSRVDKGMFIIRVADDGIGISKSDLPHVFEPFFRGASAEQRNNGVGIGLTLVRDMAMAMGGMVAADSMKDHGSVFTVKLPCEHKDENVKKRLELAVAPVRNALTKPNSEAQLSDSTQSQKDLPVVLVIEDHNDVAHLIGTSLGAKYSVFYASNGKQGLAKANELKPDLIITDVKMPLLDGCELCARIRASKQLCHIPVIILSARNSEQDRVRGLEAGADVYMVKPFRADEMRTQVGNLLSMRKMLREAYSSKQETAIEPVTPVTNDGNRQFLEKFVRLIDKQMATGTLHLDIDAVAMEFKMGESQLKRKIQSLTGKSLNSYVSQLRMEKAHRLLTEHPDMLIGDVAEQCGFVDVAYFSRVFRQYFKMTPTQCRNNDAK